MTGLCGNEYINATTTLPIKTGLMVSPRYSNSKKRTGFVVMGIKALPIKGINMLPVILLAYTKEVLKK